MASFSGVTIPEGMMPGGGGGTIASPPTNIPAGALADYSQLFAGLLELRWKDVSIPYTQLRTRLRQDLAIHKLTDRDGALVEGTGRAPLEITARLPLINGIKPSANEHWQLPLYPFTWRALFQVCSDKATGTLQHPELGDLTCKLETMDTVWDGNVAAGVFVDMAWIETDDTADQVNQSLQNNASPLANLAKFANDLGVAIASINPSIFPQPFEPPTSFHDLARSVQAVFNIPTLLSNQYAGQIASIQYDCKNTIAAAKQAGQASSLNWPLLLSSYGMLSASYDVQATQLNSGRPIGTTTIQKDMTLAQVANSIPAPVDQIMQLNPGYAGMVVIPKGSVIRFYAAKRAA